MSPLMHTVRLAAWRGAWVEQQREYNVYEYRRGDTVVRVAYTFGGAKNIAAVRYERGETVWRMYHKTPGKRERVLAVLQDD